MHAVNAQWHTPTHPPPGTYALDVVPADVRIGDCLKFGDVYHPVVDMRSAGPAGKVLLFAAHEPFTLRERRKVYRAINTLGALPHP